MVISVNDIKMDLGIEVGSPSGMGQLIRYFEVQSQRLDRQSLHSSQSAISCLNSNFQSLIKFDGVPILAPAITSSRRESLKDDKKNAVLLEKKLKLRQRRQQNGSASISSQSLLKHPPSPETLNRTAARQLNFDAGSGEQNIHSNTPTLRHRLGATNPLSTFATADSERTEDFGMRTMDSVNSEFMSLEEGTLPTVFSGHALKSLKEQKISYDLDRLCKELNVQDLGSTSGSDLSDALANSQMIQTGDQEALLREKWAEKVVTKKGGEADGFCQESQDTVVEVSPESGSEHVNSGSNNSATSGFVENSVSNLERTQTSIGSSPGCGSANTTDSQKSKVHFASYILEYNTSASQSFESTTIVKKKLSASELQDSQDLTNEESGGDNSRSYLTPSSSKPIEIKGKSTVNRKTSNEGKSNDLLNRVSFQQDSDLSPTTPLYNPSLTVPFQNYGMNEACISEDKENDVSWITEKQDQNSSQVGNQNYRHSSRVSPNHVIDHQGSQRSRVRESSRVANDLNNQQDVSQVEISNPLHGETEMSVKSYATAGMGCATQTLLYPSTPVTVGASHQEIITSCDSENLVSISQVSLGLHSSGVGSVNKLSVSESQGSARSTILTGTSESSSSTIKEDVTPKNMIDLGMNIVEGGSGNVQLQERETNSNRLNNNTNNINEDPEKREVKYSDNTNSNISSMSPKNAKDSNTNNKKQTNDNVTPPKQTHVRRGSYTLSHPSPALIQAKGQLDAKEEKEKFEDEDEEKFDSGDENNTSENDNSLKNKINFNELLQDLDGNNNPPDLEKEGKAEHINKYLRHVQFQNSMNLQSIESEQDLGMSELDLQTYEDQDNGEMGESENHIISVIQSIAESNSSVDKLSDIEVQTLHQKQMELARQAVVEQQRKEMEELFVQQRRELMMFEAEIRMAQEQSLEHHKFLIQNAPENLKIKARNHEHEFSPESTSNSNLNSNTYKMQHQTENTVGSIDSLDNLRPQSLNRLSTNENQSSGYPSLNLQPKSYPSQTSKSSKHQNVVGVGGGRESKRAINDNHYSSKSVDNIIPHEYKYNLNHKGKHTEDLYFKPRPSNEPNIPEFGSPSVSSPRMYRGGGINYGERHSRRKGPISVPPEAYHPQMKLKFNRLSAVAKGFLTRCLMKSDRVQSLIKTIKDTREFFFSFQTETPIKKGNLTSQDKGLRDRLQAQLQGALFDIHEIFFDMNVDERMGLIEQTRAKEYTKKSRDSTDVSRASGPRMSQATLKALERKRKAREAEAIAILSVSMNSSVSRPRTAGTSSNNSSPRCQNHSDSSGPLKRHFGYLISRALKPLQQSHQQSSTSRTSNTSSSNKDKKDKLQNPTERQLTRPKRITVPSSRQPHPSNTADNDRETGLNKPTASTTAKVIAKSKVVPGSNKLAVKPTKSWR